MQIRNRKASYNYELLERFEAGIALTGAEVKAVRAGRASIAKAYAKIIGGEVYLVNANIAVEDKSTRTRKLLLHKKEIESLTTKIKAKKLTLVPVSMYTRGHLIKVKIALAKAKRKFEKKEAIKKKDIEREVERELKGT